MTTSTQPSVAEVLDLAADKIERDGWCKGEFGTGDGPCCMVGALTYIAPDTWWPPREAILSSAEADGIAVPDLGVVGLNDSLDTKEQAVTTLRRAAMRARGETPGPLAAA